MIISVCENKIITEEKGYQNLVLFGSSKTFRTVDTYNIHNALQKLKYELEQCRLKELDHFDHNEIEIDPLENIQKWNNIVYMEY